MTINFICVAYFKTRLESAPQWSRTHLKTRHNNNEMKAIKLYEESQVTQTESTEGPFEKVQSDLKDVDVQIIISKTAK